MKLLDCFQYYSKLSMTPSNGNILARMCSNFSIIHHDIWNMDLLLNTVIQRRNKMILKRKWFSIPFLLRIGRWLPFSTWILAPKTRHKDKKLFLLSQYIRGYRSTLLFFLRLKLWILAKVRIWIYCFKHGLNPLQLILLL